MTISIAFAILLHQAMNQVAFETITKLFDQTGVPYQVFVHEDCRTSEESARVRKAAGMPDAIGAKAILCKVDFKTGSEFVVFVLPGPHTINKQKLKAGLPELKQFRFATPDELMDIAGVVPGCMPPFGSQIFPKVNKLYMSSAINNFERVAFNAAKLDTSIVLLKKDYLQSAKSDGVFDFSDPKITS
jgi:Ala-tRNA(Pro) deacylase